MRPSELRQHPFSHPLQFVAQGQKNRRNISAYLPSRTPKGSFRLAGRLQKKGALKDRPDPRQLPLCTLLQKLAVSRKLQCLKHNPDPAKLVRTSFSPEGHFQKKGGFYLPIRLPSTTLLHFPDRLNSDPFILPFWRKTLPC